MATAEYAALSLLVAGVVGAGGATLDGAGVASAVGDGVRRALCTVAGGPCDAHGRTVPCVTSSTTDERRRELTIAVVRLSDGRRVLRERLSDGTVRVTVTQSSGAGGIATFGGRLRLGSVRLDAGVEVAAQAGAGLGRTFLVGGDAAADRLVERLERQDWKVAGVLKGVHEMTSGAWDADQVDAFLGLESRGDADGALGALGFEPVTATALAGRVAGVRRERRGALALVLRTDGRFGAAIDARVAGLAGAAGLARSAELELDRDRRPVALTVTAAGDVRGTGGGGAVELTERLDLTDPQARRLAGRLLDGHPGALVPLARRLADQGRTELRRYAVTEGPSRTRGGSAALGVGAGYETASTSEHARLVSATGRDPGAGWSRRLDCELAAGAPLA